MFMASAQPRCIAKFPPTLVPSSTILFCCAGPVQSNTYSSLRQQYGHCHCFQINLCSLRPLWCYFFFTYKFPLVLDIQSSDMPFLLLQVAGALLPNSGVWGIPCMGFLKISCSSCPQVPCYCCPIAAVVCDFLFVWVSTCLYKWNSGRMISYYNRPTCWIASSFFFWILLLGDDGSERNLFFWTACSRQYTKLTNFNILTITVFHKETTSLLPKVDSFPYW